jgi:hypothetical protein
MYNTEYKSQPATMQSVLKGDLLLLAGDSFSLQNIGIVDDRLRTGGAPTALAFARNWSSFASNLQWPCMD